MKGKLKKYTAVCFTVIVCLFFTQASAMAAVPVPRVAVQISMVTDADSLEDVEAGSSITATVTWKSMFAQRGEPITIQTENGAEILIQDESDVIFKADGVPTPVSAITCSEDGSKAQFLSGIPASSPLNNELVFKIKAPQSSGSFRLSVKIGADATVVNPLTNYVEKEFTVAPFITVEKSSTLAAEGQTFEIYGKADPAHAFMVAAEAYHQETGAIAFGATTMDIQSDGSYNLGTFSFDSSNAAGIYVIEAVLLDSSFQPVDTAQTTIEHTKLPIGDPVISTKYILEETGEILYSYSIRYDYGEIVDISPGLILPSYGLSKILINGEPSGYTSMPIIGPVDVVFLYYGLYNPTISCVSLNNGWLFRREIQSGGGYKAGTVIIVTAPELEDHGDLVGVLVNGVRAELINGNQVEVTVEKGMDIVFEYTY